MATELSERTAEVEKPAVEPRTRGLAGLVRKHWVLILALTVCAGLAIGFLAQTTITIGGVTYFSLADDVMISMTYARNLAEGHGLVWSPGAAPVEGFTNPLWTVWLAVLHLLTPVERFAPLLAALSGLATLLAGLGGVYALCRRLDARPAGQLFALLSAATLYAPAFWALRGFEVGLIAAIVTWMLVLALDRERSGWKLGMLLGVLGSVAFLTRMDSLVLSAAVILLRAFPISGHGLETRRILEEWIAAGVVIAAVAAAMMAARFLYYGDVLPNTAYLKLGAASLDAQLLRGFRADANAISRWAPLGLLALIPLPGMLRMSRPAALAYSGVLFVIAIQLLYTIYVGGDAWEWSGFPNRFVSIVAFPLCACAGVKVGKLIDLLKTSERMRHAASAGLAIIVFGWTSFGDWRNTFSGAGFSIREEGYLIKAGLALKESTPPGFRYALNWAGTIPYYAEGRVPVDMLGKMDAVIARMPPADRSADFNPGHTKYNLDYSVGELRPDAVIQAPYEVHLGKAGSVEKMVAWGYEQGRGGWWILKTSRPKLLAPTLLDYSFEP